MRNEEWLIGLVVIDQLTVSNDTCVAGIEGQYARAYRVPSGWEPIGCVPDRNGLTIVIRKRRE